MSDLDRSLRETLSSGASRILNAAEATKRIVEKQGTEKPTGLMFKNRALNDCVFIKRPKDSVVPQGAGLVSSSAEILENGQLKTVDFGGGQVRVEKGDIATDLYCPYDPEWLLDGGNSFDLTARGRVQALMDLVGFDVRGEGEAAKADAKLLELIQGLPSLDPFLLKDLLEAEGYEVDEEYFDISDEEFQEIKRFILEKFRPITERVVDPSRKDAAQISEQFIMKLWEAKDMKYLAPITTVFRLDETRAGEIYYSWKGVTYYEFIYKRSQKTMLVFAAWLQTEAQPEQFMRADMREEIDGLTKKVANTFARHLKNCSEILKLYNSSYENLFVHGGEPRPFIDFLKQSNTLFWDISASISALNYGVSVWQDRQKRAGGKRPSPDELKTLLELLDRVIV